MRSDAHPYQVVRNTTVEHAAQVVLCLVFARLLGTRSVPVRLTLQIDSVGGQHQDTAPRHADGGDAHVRQHRFRGLAHAGPGGKGVNVARTAEALGCPAELVAFLPRGRSGEAVGAWLADAGIALHAVLVPGEVRWNRTRPPSGRISS